MELLVSSAPSVIPTTLAHALLIMVEQIVIVSTLMCALIWGSVTCSHNGLFLPNCHAVCVLPCPLGYGPNSACTGCVPVHICVTDNPCENGGTCNIGTNNNTDYTCSCATNFSGKNCTSKLTPGSQLWCNDCIRKWHSASIRRWCSVSDAKLYSNWVSLHLLKHGCNKTLVKPTTLCPYCKPGLILTNDLT